MARVSWVINRFRAMSVREISWRVQQTFLERVVERRYSSSPVSIISEVFRKDLRQIRLQPQKLYLCYGNAVFSFDNDIDLLGGYDYHRYMTDWLAGFQTERRWPIEYSYSLNYKQRDDIGDARTNWELNRHHQFAVLAKLYYTTKDKNVLDKFKEQFYDWNKINPFLVGISWTSVMEVAIRLSNWCYAYAFLCEAGNVDNRFLDDMQTGIINMTEHVNRHYSKYSSANNHLIVEAYAIGLAGIMSGYQKWLDTAIMILSDEIIRQTYPDGINKELCLHYQAFVMEAIGLLVRLMQKNHITVPQTWTDMLEKMSSYVFYCIADNGEAISFGDSDKGRILDFEGKRAQHYLYVLALMSYVLPVRYTEFENETIRWLFSESDKDMVLNKPVYKSPGSACYDEGGYTLLRSNDGNILIGIDHAQLGYGTIAAHGHADALSFQMIVGGKTVFADPGTYIYHIELDKRNEFRKTRNHNTVCIADRDQSEMLGPFLWGRKAECRLLGCEIGEQSDIVEAEHNGYLPDKHNRLFIFNKTDELVIRDTIESPVDWTINYLLSPEASEICLADNGVSFSLDSYCYAMVFESSARLSLRIAQKEISLAYGSKQPACAIVAEGKGNALVSTKIHIRNK